MKNFSQADLDYLKGKGYSDKEIAAIWNEDKKQGKGPQMHTNKPWIKK